jgi:hypothetical protein
MTGFNGIETEFGVPIVLADGMKLGKWAKYRPNPSNACKFEDQLLLVQTPRPSLGLPNSEGTATVQR